jgi:hypothetical protein
MQLPRSRWPIALALCLATPAAAQSVADSGAFVIRLGHDTLGVERYTRSPHELRSDIVLRVPDARRVRYVATLDGGGGVSGLDLAIEPLGRGAGRGQPARGVMRFRGDTADVALTLGDSTRRIAVPARAGAVPLAAFSHALIEQAILQARRDGRDSVAFDWVGLGSPKAMPSYVVRCGDDSVRVAFFGDPSFIKLDRAGRIVGLDGRATTQKVEVERRPTVDLDRYAAAFAAAQEAAGPMGPLSPRDTVQETIDGARLTVEYSRPRKRGRSIFGGVVAWNRVWRLGANAATHFSTTADLDAGGRVIPAGTYTLWMLPTPGGDTLIVNRQIGQWGTAYDPAQDLARLALERETWTPAAEQFTIAVEPSSSGGTLRLSWDTTSYRLPFSVRRPSHATGS